MIDLGDPAFTPPEVRLESDLVPLCVDASGLGVLLDLSPRQIARLDSAGKLPAPIAFGRRSKRWCVEEVQEWIAAGAPPRTRWAAMRRGGK